MVGSKLPTKASEEYPRIVPFGVFPEITGMGVKVGDALDAGLQEANAAPAIATPLAFRNPRRDKVFLVATIISPHSNNKVYGFLVFMAVPDNG